MSCFCYGIQPYQASLYVLFLSMYDLNDTVALLLQGRVVAAGAGGGEYVGHGPPELQLHPALDVGSLKTTDMSAPVVRPATALTPLQSLIARRWRPQWTCQSCKHRQRQVRAFSATTIRVDESSKPYYVTTPIFYPSAAAHTGHAYSMVIGDVLKGWQVLKGRKAILATGVDEHGMKIQRAAAKAGIAPKELCDKNAQIFRDLAEKMGLSNDVFVRTTDPKHKEAVQYACQMLQGKGYIYESKHEGWYSVSDETFYPEGQVHLIVDPPTGRKIMASIETGSEVEWTSERNYHFRLSAFRERLLEFYNDNPAFIVPKTRMDDIVNQVTQNLEDLSISRPSERLDWGVRVPNDPSQTIYVWLDALLNYASAAGYPFLRPGHESTGGWPADVHVIGKDIVRFHCIYWPAFLMALDLPLPKQVLTHAHWTLGRQKMAKSTGNVVNPFWAMERFGTDVMRWYLVQEGGITNDADYDNSFIIDKYKKGLQGGLGGLTSRVMRTKVWDVPRAVKRYASPNPNILEEKANKDRPIPFNDSAQAMLAHLTTLPLTVDQHMRDLYPNKAVQTLMRAVFAANAYLQASEPWKAARKADPSINTDARKTTSTSSIRRIGGHSDLRTAAEVDAPIFLCAETLRLVGIMLQPVMPSKARLMLHMLGVKEERRGWEWCGIGKDGEYGVSFVDMDNRGGMLFPKLSSEY